jgi:hypothetical protein
VTTSGVLLCFVSSSEAKRRRRLASTPRGCSEAAVVTAEAASATSLALTIMGAGGVECISGVRGGFM